MGNNTVAHLTVEACDFIIGRFNNYADQLVEFDKNTNQELDTLAETHRDQNFLKFDDNFSPLWADILKFKDVIDQFVLKMGELKEIIKKAEDLTNSSTGNY